MSQQSIVRRPPALLLAGSVLAASGIAVAIWLLVAGILTFLVIALVLVVVGFALVRLAFARGKRIGGQMRQ